MKNPKKPVKFINIKNFLTQLKWQKGVEYTNNKELLVKKFYT